MKVKDILSDIVTSKRDIGKEGECCKHKLHDSFHAVLYKGCLVPHSIQYFEAHLRDLSLSFSDGILYICIVVYNSFNLKVIGRFLQLEFDVKVGHFWFEKCSILNVLKTFFFQQHQPCMYVCIIGQWPPQSRSEMQHLVLE